MSHFPFPERVSEAFIRASGLHEVVNPGSAPEHRGRPLSIAISRVTGTRGPAVARSVGELLGWPVYDHELLDLVARDLNVRAKVLADLDERHVTWLQECVEAFAAVPAVRESKYVQHLIKVMMSLAERGHNVIVGRGGPFVLPAATTLRVRLIAPLDDRVAVIGHERQMTRTEAARLVERTDRERARFVRLHFQRDPSDLSHYDL
ncbi:MAG TPA: cytidylate kinase-like family protein, partial [Planctomycetaceae bacterium]